MKTAEEIKILEEKLLCEERAEVKHLLGEELQVLQTRTVPLEEVKRDMDLWKPFRKKWTC